MNRHPIVTHARALSGGVAFVRVGVGLGWLQAIAGVRSPGEGVLASP
ncbi:MAG: hypothetical protein IT503_17980 [Burkholderiaceae bacterium]|nr:hypothetical protein [Burkholderiaceae bacterium]